MATARRCGLMHIVTVGVLVSLLGLAAGVSAGADIPISDKSSSEINLLLTDHVAEFIRVNDSRHRNTRGQVRVAIDPEVGLVVINLSEGFLPKFDPVENEELEGWLAEEVQSVVGDTIVVREVRFLYGGKLIHEFFNKRQSSVPLGSLLPNIQYESKAGNGPIVVSAGHGLFYHYGQGWVPQRPEFFGIREDFITPVFASMLASELSPYPSYQIRSLSSGTHVPSGAEWRQVSARYFLESTFPTRPDIWNTQSPNRTDDERERYDDIYSRPYFANALSTRALFNLHTNGHDGTARGTRVYFYPGRSESQALAQRVLCSMKEVIHAVEDYEDWSVAQAPVGMDHAENREVDPSIPSIIVEVGFHDNALDAEILQQPDFQAAAMRGVAKGYELHLADKDCQEFKIVHVPDVTSQTPSSFDIQVDFEGNPTPWVSLRMPDCSGVSWYVGCGGWQISPVSPVTVTNYCMEPGTTTRRMWLTDDDGVTTDIFLYTVTCT